MQCNPKNMPNQFGWEEKHAVFHHESFKNVFEVNESILEARKLISIQKRFKWSKSHANPLRKTQVMSKNEGI